MKQSYMVPLGWLVAVVGACVTAITLSFGVGVAVATLSSKVDAQGSDVAKLQEDDLPGRMIRVETLLSLAYPDEYREALKRRPAGKK